MTLNGEANDSSPRGPALERWRLLAVTLGAQRRGLALATAVGLGWSAAKVAIPQLTRLAIDRGVDGGGSLLAWTVLIAAVGIAIGTFTAFRRYYAFREARWTETRLRERLFDHVMSLHIGYHDRAQTGQLMSRASSDLTMLQMFVVMVPITIANLAMMTAAVAILVSTDALLAVVALLPLPLVMITATRFSKRIHPTLMDVQAEQAELATVVEESVAGVRVVKGFGAEETRSRRVEHEADDIQTASLRAARIRGKFLPLVEGLPQLGLIAVLGIGGHRAIDGHLTIGQLVAFTTYITLLIAPLRMTGLTVAWGQRAGVALERINEVLSTVPRIADPAEPESLPVRRAGEPVGRVEMHGVRFGYDPAQPVLQGFDLVVPAGGSVALVGGTGSGKSTVARLLVRFYEPQAGTISVDGVPIDRLRLHDLRRAVGIVFEDTLLFHDTVAANIAFACPDAEPPQIEQAARLAGAHDFITRLPEGYATLIGERGFSLSGGQRQRIAIARAILADPRVLVLDDATSAVDPSKEHEIREAMRTVMDGRTTFVIAHRPGTIALADSVVFISGGVVAAAGTHDHLVATNADYRSVLAAMSTRAAALEGDDVADDSRAATVGD
ncbi:ABC transporter ATP-binding protein [Desertimonas flava]|uniref:ABC transporter ATP-binding protein n=1 Tax=Desertimonas flava TaxID=2064846 RepID=UPI000E343291|nr:ABC transporter ATP-binding protein [Desertimonas flava]